MRMARAPATPQAPHLRWGFLLRPTQRLPASVARCPIGSPLPAAGEGGDQGGAARRPLLTWQFFLMPPPPHQSANPSCTLIDPWRRAAGSGANMSAAALGHCGIAASPGARQQACPLRQSSFHGSSVASCSYRPQLSLQPQSRRSRVHATTVVSSAAAPWANDPAARWGRMGPGDAAKELTCEGTPASWGPCRLPTAPPPHVPQASAGGWLRVARQSLWLHRHNG